MRGQFFSSISFEYYHLASKKSKSKKNKVFIFYYNLLLHLLYINKNENY